MHVGGRPTVCPECDSPLWLVLERLEPLSGLYIGELACLGCDEGRLYARVSEHAPLEADDLD